jgi:two-component system OmpR family sensor kinase
MEHVFPEGADVLAPPRAAAVAGAGVPGCGRASAAVSYWSYCADGRRFMDDQMQQLADAIAGRTRCGAAAAPERRTRAQVGRCTSCRPSPDGKLQLPASWELGAAAAPRASTTSTTAAPGASTRAAGGTRAGTARAGAAERQLPRTLAAERAGAAIAPVLLLLPLSMLVLWGVARAISGRCRTSAAGRAAGRAQHRRAAGGARAAGDRAAGAPSTACCALAREPSPRSGASCRTPRMNCARRSRPSACSWRTCADMTCRPARTALQRSSKPACAGPSAWSTSCCACRARKRRRRRPGHRGPAGAAAREHQHADRAGRPAQHRPRPGRAAGRSPRRHAALRAGDLRSVLDNLIENALRYTPEGGVVDVRLLQDRAASPLEVVDTGPGIPQETAAARVRPLLPRAGQRRQRQRPGAGHRTGGGAALRPVAHAAQSAMTAAA